MKVAIITDTHAGVRGDVNSFADYQDRFYADFFFPALKTAGITTILHGGDFFDRRQFVTLKTMDRLRQTFCECLKDGDFRMHVIVGNHDVLYRNTNDVNSPDVIFHGYDNVTVHTTPAEVEGVLLVPWINRENYESVVKTMNETSAKHVLGHFEIKGFEMHRGSVCESGLDSELFSRFQTVMSGHFHTRSSAGNITYLGSPFELTWADYNDPKGFHIFDTETGDLDFIQTPESMFFRCEYDTVENVRSWTPYKPVSLTDKYVKIVVKNKGSAYEFDKWIKEITAYSPADIQIIESAVDITGVELTLEELEQKSKSNIDIIKDYVNALEISDKQKNIVFDYMKTLYAEVNVL